MKRLKSIFGMAAALLMFVGIGLAEEARPQAPFVEESAALVPASTLPDVAAQPKPAIRRAREIARTSRTSCYLSETGEAYSPKPRIEPKSDPRKALGPPPFGAFRT